MPKISVVTGYYNRRDYLERTIESILKQSFQDFELIVFDDCSTDGTASRLKQLSEKYQDIRFKYVVHEENKGFVKGLIDAIELSTGDLIAIQGSGDVSRPTRLEKQFDYLNSHPEVGAVGGFVCIKEEDGPTESLHDPTPRHYSFDDLIKQSPFTHGEVMFRKSVYEEVGGYREAFQFAQDRDLWLRMSKIADLAVIPEVLYERFTLMDGVSFVPEKVIKQNSFSVAAVKLSQMEAEEEERYYSILETEGPEALVPFSDPEIQRFVPRAALRLTMYGEPERAIQMLKKYMSPSWRRTLLQFSLKFYSSRLVAPLRKPGRAIFRKVRLAFAARN